MIQAILLILKIIGITVLVILGLLLLVLFLVLFVPVCYRVRLVYNEEKIRVSGKVSFLFPLLAATFQYLEKFSFKVRVFFFPVLDSEKMKKEKKQKRPKKRKEKKKKAGKRAEKESIPGHQTVTETGLEPEKSLEAKCPAPQKEIVEIKPGKETEQEPRRGFFEKISLKLKKIRETISSIFGKIKKLLHQKEELQRILNNPSTRRTFAFVWGELKHLLKHVFPRKMKGYVKYGADDPATTGKALGVLSIVYAKTGQLLEIYPNFEEKQLECDVEIKGHIQMFTLLVIAIKVFLHQELRQVITEFKNVKEIE